MLRLTGNALARPPADITYYRDLKELYLGSNQLVDVKWVFECRGLLHAGLSYNAVASLPLSLPNTNLVLVRVCTSSVDSSRRSPATAPFSTPRHSQFLSHLFPFPCSILRMNPTMIFAIETPGWVSTK